LQRFIEDVMGGDNSHVITVLKCVNQTAISPAIIELKFALGNQCMTKDVKLGWKIEFYLKPGKLKTIFLKNNQTPCRWLHSPL